MHKKQTSEKPNQIEIEIEDSQKKSQQHRHQAANIGTANQLRIHELGPKGYTLKKNLQVSDEQTIGAAFGGMLICTSIIMLIFNLAFIIPNLIYANKDESCVTTYVDGFSFNLSTWLKVDAALRIVMCVSFFVVGVMTCIKLAIGYILLCLVLVFLVLYTIFQFTWLIAGSVLFWGKLNPLGVCTGGVQAYMFANLIINLLGGCGNCYSIFSLKATVDIAKLSSEERS